jgi:hypothetical protein
MATSLNTIKNWFKTGLKPTQAQFWAWMDSFWHKDEQIPMAKIDGITNLISQINANLDGVVHKQGNETIKDIKIFNDPAFFERGLRLGSNVSKFSYGEGEGFYFEEEGIRAFVIAPDVFVFGSVDTNKSIQFRQDLVTQHRIVQWPNKSGTVAMTSDIPSGGAISFLKTAFPIGSFTGDPYPLVINKSLLLVSFEGEKILFEGIDYTYAASAGEFTIIGDLAAQIATDPSTYIFKNIHITYY